jgi:HKD family nuclease
MIEVSSGEDVNRLLARVASHPGRYANITLCSPFIDEEMLDRVLPLAHSAKRADCRVRLITSPEAARRLLNRCDALRDGRLDIVTTSPRLHAKVYLAIARCSNDTEAIVTSANLTNAGVYSNIELGVRVTPTSKSGRRLLDHVRHFIKRLAA